MSVGTDDAWAPPTLAQAALSHNPPAPATGKAVNMFSPLFVNVPQLLLLRWRVSLPFMPPLPFLNVARPKHYCCILARSLLSLFWLETVVCNALLRPSLSFCPLSASLIILAVFLLSFPPKTEELQIRWLRMDSKNPLRKAPVQYTPIHTFLSPSFCLSLCILPCALFQLDKNINTFWRRDEIVVVVVGPETRT
jgi:hypothetical protein